MAREASQRVPGDASTFIEKINDRPSLFTDSRDEPLSPIAMNRDLFFPHGGFHSDIFRALEEMQRHLFDSFQNDPFFRQHDFFSNNRFPPPPSPSSSNPDGMIPPSDVGGIPRVRDRNPNFVPHHSRQPLPKGTYNLVILFILELIHSQISRNPNTGETTDFEVGADFEEYCELKGLIDTFRALQ